MTSARSVSSTSLTSAWARHFTRGLLLCSVLLVLAWFAQPDGKLHVLFPATPGDAVLIQTPGGKWILIDGGSDPARITTFIGRQLPFWQRSLDAVVLTTFEPAHISGQVAVLARYRTGFALAPAPAQHSSLAAEWQRVLHETSTPVVSARAGDAFELDGVTLHVLATGDGSERGLIMRLDYGATSVVLSHSANAPDEQALADAGELRPASLLAFPWQRDLHTPFAEALLPQAIVLTDGIEVVQPLEETLYDRAASGAQLYHEKLHGTIEWVSDGRQAWITTER